MFTARLPRRLMIALALTVLAAGPVYAGPKPPKTVTKPLPGGGSITITLTDVDGDGTYDKSMYEEKNPAGQVIRRVSETDSNNDGKAETSTFEEYADPTNANPSHKETRTKGAADSDWHEVTTETDADQDGRKEKTKTATSTRGDGNFDIVETQTDANDNGTVEHVERKLADPGGSGYTTQETITNDDTTGNETGRTQKEGKFGPVDRSQVPVEMFTPPGKTGAGVLRHDGTAVVDAAGGLEVTTHITAFAGLTPTEDPTLDNTLIASLTTPVFSAVSTDLLINTTGGEIVIAQDGALLLHGVVPELHALGGNPPHGSLDPGAQSAFFGVFALDTLRLAGVDPGSPFFDPGFTGSASPFILDLARLLDPASPDYLAFGSLMFRFDAADDLTAGGFASAALSSGTGTVRVKAVPEPTSLLLLAIGCVLLTVLASPRRIRIGLQ